MAKIIVRYNGGTEHFDSCSEPTELVVDQEYEVIDITTLFWQTNYTLKGVNGSFNSCWFDKVVFDYVPTFMALAHTIPTIGKNMHCYKIEFLGNQPQLTPWLTTTVQDVQFLGNHIYQVTTANSIYIVKVN